MPYPKATTNKKTNLLRIVKPILPLKRGTKLTVYRESHGMGDVGVKLSNGRRTRGLVPQADYDLD